MVNTVSSPTLRPLTRAVGLYVVVAVATVVALALLSARHSGQATTDAWVHAVIVVAFAALLPLRLRSARRGDGGALTAVRVIAAVLLVANVIEAVLPGTFPAWMRVEMVGIAGLMLVTFVLAVRARR